MKRLAILGSGLIGCDLLVKCQKSNQIEVVGIAGRNKASKGIAFATSRGIFATDQSIEGLLNTRIKPDVIVDCTSASQHSYHYEICKNEGIRIIDMTPAKIGVACCPAINLADCLDSDNINMISCGGQAALPICFAIKQNNPEIEYMEVVSTVASASVGPGTRQNISEYIISTQKVIEDLLKIRKAKVIVNISPAKPPLMMKTSVIVDSDCIASVSSTADNINQLVAATKQYVPGYRMTMEFGKIGHRALCQVMVSGCGDYLPEYAGNLDIINCSALEVIKRL